MRKALAVAAIVLLLQAARLFGQQDTFWTGGTGGMVYRETTNYFADAKEMGCNWLNLDVNWPYFDPGLLDQQLDSAAALGMKVMLGNAKTPNDPWDITISAIAGGQFAHHEAEDLQATGDTGHLVTDYLAEGNEALCVHAGMGAQSFQRQAKDDGFVYQFTRSGADSGFHHTVYYTLRADTQHSGQDDHVCSLWVAMPLDSVTDSLVACRTLHCSDFPKRDSYCEFAVEDVPNSVE
jgi:hypothetical protein